MTCASCEKLRAELAPHRLRAAYRLTPQESAMVMAMYRAGGNPVSAERLVAATPEVGMRPRSSGGAKVAVHYMRSKMGTGVIRTVDEGYCLTPEGRDRVEEVVG